VAGRSKRLVRAAATCGAAGGGLASAHLLMLLAAAARRPRQPAAASRGELGLAVMIPAHDEEPQIVTAVRSVRACEYAPGSRRIIVIADNCSDRTAVVARAAGAEVWERSDPTRRGKGHALAWAFERVLKDDSIRAVCVIDADCRPSRNFLSAVAVRIDAGSDAVQARYLVSNPERSAATALRWAGFALFNVVRPLGRDQLGLSSGLLGTGMAFSRRLLMHSPWQAFSFAEDREQHMRWVLDGARVVFAPEAEVYSPSPAGSAGIKAQERRWESGRLALAARLSPKLLAWSTRRRSLVELDAAVEPLLPPQSLLLAINLGAAAGAVLTGARRTSLVAAGGVVAQAVYVLGGLALVRAPASVWRAFATLPRFLVRRMCVLIGAAAGPSAWVRTPREPEPASESSRGEPIQVRRQPADA
jgi:1,2-diacylglycerol 3-beta-glucosyltransferase